MASIRPVVFLAAKCSHAPMQTIQLHATADTKARPKSIWTFASATAIVFSTTLPSVMPT